MKQDPNRRLRGKNRGIDSAGCEPGGGGVLSISLPVGASIGRAVEGWIAHIEAKGQSPATIRTTRNMVAAFYRLSGLDSSSPLTSVTRAIGERVMRRLQAKYAEGTAWKYGAHLVQIFRAFTTSGLLFENPFAHLARPRKPRICPKPVLSANEVKALFEAPNLRMPSGIRNRAILEVFYSTGIRLSECARLELRDVDFVRGTLTVRGGKGGKDRVAPLGETAIAWLRRYIVSVRTRFAGKSTALWVGQTGRPVASFWIQVTIRRLGRKIGKRVTPHTLRRTCATHLHRNGASAWVVKELLGHADAKTLAHYLQIEPKDVKETHEKTHPRS